jgi:hypothetical protein
LNAVFFSRLCSFFFFFFVHLLPLSASLKMYLKKSFSSKDTYCILRKYLLVQCYANWDLIPFIWGWRQVSGYKWKK